MKRRNKFNAIRTYSELCERTFDSKKEAKRGEELKRMEMAGEISNLRFQVWLRICPVPDTKMRVDFTYIKDNQLIHEDTKGFITRTSAQKLKMLKNLGVEVLIT